MTTWTFRGPLAACALVALTACEDGQTGGFLQGIGITDSSEGTKALSRARMAFGAVTLVAPDGFCIDERTLKQRFALMARCDKLGVPSAAGSAPLAVITASFSKADDTGSLPTPEQTAQAFGLENVSATRTSDARVIFKAVATDPEGDLGALHWRGSARVGDQLMGLALYGPADGRATTREGRDILDALIEAAEPAS